MALTGSFNSALPVISLYVFAGYRLMPALQQIYSSFTQLTFVGPSLDKLTSDIKNLKPFNENQDKGVLSLNKAITLKNIHYEYPNASRTALKNINLSILAKSTVGIVGATGSGKTTTVDIILGLLEPQKGALEVDGKVITQHNSRSWQRSIGYVPQHIYLSDDTIAANIAFGVEPHDIDLIAVEKAAKIANLHNFLIDELPEQYQTTIGERGVRLSGGQRQRIGIARALYYNPNILILDEATSALDSQTEKAVMDAVNNLRKDITIIIIAHRLATIKKCDKIFLLEKGQIKNEGTFEELKNVNENFRLNVNN
jgi:ABC-type multidrug transport system fused ATPase/permease subunit